MIIFHTIPAVSVLEGLVFGGHAIDSMATIPFTLFGLYQSGEPLNNLIPKPEFIPEEYIMNDTESTFDYYFWKQIQEDPHALNEKMRILEPEFLYGKSVLILIQTNTVSPYRNSITESLIGYFRTFYGIECKLITSTEDLTDPNFFDYGGFSQEGLFRLTRELEFIHQGDQLYGYE